MARREVRSASAPSIALHAGSLCRAPGRRRQAAPSAARSEFRGASRVALAARDCARRGDGRAEGGHTRGSRQRPQGEPRALAPPRAARLGVCPSGRRGGGTCGEGAHLVRAAPARGRFTPAARTRAAGLPSFAGASAARSEPPRGAAASGGGAQPAVPTWATCTGAQSLSASPRARGDGERRCSRRARGAPCRRCCSRWLPRFAGCGDGRAPGVSLCVATRRQGSRANRCTAPRARTFGGSTRTLRSSGGCRRLAPRGPWACAAVGAG